MRHRSNFMLLCLLLGPALDGGRAVAGPAPPPAVDSVAAGSPFYSSEDGMLDLSTFMERKFGFLPIPFPVTEPAVGYGGGVMVAFIDKPRAATQGGFDRPNISMAGGLATENGTWLAMLADIRYWRNDALKTLMAGSFASLNLDFGGVGSEANDDRPLLRYNLEPQFFTLQGMQRMRRTSWWTGLRYAFATSDVRFDAPDGTPGLPQHSSRSAVGSLAPSVIFDSRDNSFTPVTGNYAEVYVGFYRRWLGSDDEFESVEFIGIHYRPLGPGWFLGLRGDAKSKYGQTPFYVLPYVEMRGVPAMRYLGQVVTQAEAELRWQCLGRWSLVGFGGLGVAADEWSQLGQSRAVRAGGTGFRYELARRFDIHAGMDVAWGPEGAAIYFQTGSAWGRP